MVGTNETIYSRNCRDFVFGDLDENIKTKISRIEHLANLRRRDGPTGTNLSQSFFKSSHFFGTCFHDGRGVNGSENRVRFCKRHAFHTMKDKLRRSLRVVQKKNGKSLSPSNPWANLFRSGSDISHNRAVSPGTCPSPHQKNESFSSDDAPVTIPCAQTIRP